jgi:hypothetical protein
MPDCTDAKLDFGRLGRRVIEANFQGGALSSDGGLMLLRQVDRRMGLSQAIASVLRDARAPDRITQKNTKKQMGSDTILGLCVTSRTIIRSSKKQIGV